MILFQARAACDWWRTKFKATGEEYNFTMAHWAITEARFRKHVKAIKEGEARELIHLDDMLVLITQDATGFIRQSRQYLPH